MLAKDWAEKAIVEVNEVGGLSFVPQVEFAHRRAESLEFLEMSPLQALSRFKGATK